MHIEKNGFDIEYICTFAKVCEYVHINCWYFNRSKLLQTQGVYSKLIPHCFSKYIKLVGSHT